ncbi:cytochrome aa3 quinol oxidase subunit II [Shimazuella sp. AN120528]|uniref:cytochrome aa3 quinol oxidase subunit II n=1 Tax=Shimazuella soli TaxID=1892854 RepID=UPI001F0D01E5|nr:cytochrome aa3 quinol oxidase subunit II [Shimazuella soli]MCH5583694.1 cytochrome aa3 quinol oxidase subunit II [Shimazuella soli]
MRLKTKYAAIFLTMALLLSGCSSLKSGVLNPQGPVAKEQYDLIIWSIVLMSIVFIAVIVLFVYMLVKYRAKSSDEDYVETEEKENKWLEILWTAIPVVIIIALSIPTVKSTFKLEKSPSPNQKPITIQVTSANWKWIFKYPEQGIETVNYVNIPANVPVRFQLNAVGPMNSFWVPELGGQEYTMPGMTMYLWLEADKAGTYIGRSANFSGKDFTHMQFNVHSLEKGKFDEWIANVKKSAPKQTTDMFKQLLQPGVVKEQTYSSYPNVDVNRLDENGNPIIAPNSHQHGKSDDTEMKMDMNMNMDMNSNSHHNMNH